MYDMYPWDTADQGDYPPEPLRSRKDRAPQPAPPGGRAIPAQAIQVALDRRDNGGDAVASARKPAAARTRQ